LPNLPGQKINEFFDLVRPIIEFKFETVLSRSNNIYEIMTNEPIDILLKAGGETTDQDQVEDDAEEGGMGDLMGEEEDKSLHLKGQMMFMAEWNVIMFLCSPSLSDLDTLSFTGLFINDLSMHDFSRDLLLASRLSIMLLLTKTTSFFKKVTNNPMNLRMHLMLKWKRRP
jgi:hypothetical protein